MLINTMKILKRYNIELNEELKKRIHILVEMFRDNNINKEKFLNEITEIKTIIDNNNLALNRINELIELTEDKEEQEQMENVYNI